MTPSIDPTEGRRAQMFPQLTPAQVGRIAAHGTHRRMRRGDVLAEQGAVHVPFWVVLDGQVEIVRPSDDGEDQVTLLSTNQFTGETNLLTRRRSLVRTRALEDGELLELDPEALRTLVQTDTELGELIMRAFILRRVGLISRELGDVVLVGAQYSRNALRLREFLMRNAHPYLYLDLDDDPDARSMLARHHAAPEDIPVLICRGTDVLRDPTFEQVAQCLGLNAEIAFDAVRDLVVVGGGPAGLAAAVYGASEGLNVLVLEQHFPGGQAGSSSKIENYLGFPTGISGGALAGRAFSQAEKFGAEVAVACVATKLDCDARPFTVHLSTGKAVRAHVVVIASGACYRRLALDNLPQFEGAGVYYAASAMEAKLSAEQDVIVVGGGNSAGQAAVFLAGSARHVHVVVRAGGLADSMSHYLIRRIEDSPRITLHTRTEIVGLEGARHLERVQWRSATTGTVETHPIRHVFLMTGAEPNTGWIRGCVALDPKGFVKTGADLGGDDLACWRLERRPYLLETSIPGIFAVGDVRSGNVKRVASAVGEGSICVQLAHKLLADRGEHKER